MDAGVSPEDSSLFLEAVLIGGGDSAPMGSSFEGADMRMLEGRKMDLSTFAAAFKPGTLPQASVDLAGRKQPRGDSGKFWAQGKLGLNIHIGQQGISNRDANTILTSADPRPQRGLEVSAKAREKRGRTSKYHSKSPPPPQSGRSLSPSVKKIS